MLEVIMKYCCSMFQDLLDDAGHRGQSVVVIDGGRQCRYQFLLQGRATKSNQPFQEVTSNPVATVMKMGIAYCPFCGVNLSEFYAHVSLPLHPELAPTWHEASQAG
jgi:hypothetical protein